MNVARRVAMAATLLGGLVTVARRATMTLLHLESGGLDTLPFPAVGYTSVDTAGRRPEHSQEVVSDE